MRIIITGSRHWIDYRRIQKVIETAYQTARSKGESLYVRHGDNPSGADHLAQNIVYQYNQSGHTDIVEEARPAEWDEYGKAAGMIRNNQMIAPGDVDQVHAFPLQDSRGTIGMMKISVDAKIPVWNHGWPGFNKQFPEGVINTTTEAGHHETHQL